MILKSVVSGGGGAGGSLTIGDAISGATSGSLLFVNASSQLAQDNSNIFYDTTNKRLGVGTATPVGALQIQPQGSGGSFIVQASTFPNQVIIKSEAYIRVDSNFIPNYNGTTSLGTGGAYWGNTYIRYARILDSLMVGNHYQGGAIPANGAKIEGNLSVGIEIGTAKLHVAGNALFQNTTDTTNAFVVKNLAGSTVPLNVDTINGILTSNILKIANIKSGATQVAAGAAADELWKTASHATLPDNVVMIGV